MLLCKIIYFQVAWKNPKTLVLPIYSQQWPNVPNSLQNLHQWLLQTLLTIRPSHLLFFPIWNSKMWNSSRILEEEFSWEFHGHMLLPSRKVDICQNYSRFHVEKEDGSGILQEFSDRNSIRKMRWLQLFKSFEKLLSFAQRSISFQ